MRAAVALAFLAFSSAAMAAAPFSGTIDVKITSTKGPGGTIHVTVGDKGALSEMTMSGPSGEAFSMKTLSQKAKPDVVIMINDAAKTYGEVPAGAAVQPGGDEHWVIKKVGKETINGFACTHVTATNDKKNVVDMWTAKDVIDPAEFQRALGKQSRVSNGLMEALKKEGADGFPVKMVTAAGDQAITMELTKITKGTPPASTFEIPAGYTKQAGPPMGGALPPEVQKQLEERMKSMTPEQRAQLEKAMAGQR